jgi:ABC-type branched-subunit amino acid transport system ATPase component
VLRLVKTSKRFGESEVLRDVSLDFPIERVTAIVGPNGAGKTTLLNVATGIEKPSTGSVWLDAENLSCRGVEPHRAAGVIRTFQEPRVFSELSMLENIRFSEPDRLLPVLWSALGFRRGRHRWNPSGPARSLLDDFGLSSQGHTICGDLSYGQRRLVELATAFASSGVVYLLDEPSAGIAPNLLPVVRSQIRSLASAGAAVVVVDHDVEFVRSIADLVVFLDKGEIVTSGPSAEVLGDPQIRWRLWGAWGG